MKIMNSKKLLIITGLFKKSIKLMKGKLEIKILKRALLLILKKKY